MNKVIQLIVLTALVTGCAQSVEVVSDFPQPLIEPLPLKVGVRFPPEIAEYVHVEDTLQEPEWTIRLGNANLAMFRTLFTGMFSQVIELDSALTGQGDSRVDLIIEPRLEELEFTVPHQSGNDQYTVWLNYTLRILDPEGELIQDWRVTAYGQKDEGAMGLGDETAMHDAVIMAMRDAAASIVVSFKSVPGLKQYLPASNDEQPDTTQ